ncbi:MAG: aspartyl/asparaginyl beta-hydroxylase domain-containing protein [Anderseniella sp.]
MNTPHTPSDTIPAKRKKTLSQKALRKFGGFFRKKIAGLQSSQSLIGDTPVLDKSHFPEFKILEENWRDVLAEVQAILKYREQVPKFHEVSEDQKNISKGDEWRTFFLFGFGTKLARNCAKAPKTAAMLEAIPNLQTAWFSILAPGAHIPPHKGVTKGIVTCHMGLIVPDNRQNCRLRVENEYCTWAPGQIFVFDDTYMHEVSNNTDQERVVLLWHVDRPMKTPARLLHKVFIAGLKKSAFFKNPQKNMATFEDRFEQATRDAAETLEKMSTH